MFELDQLEDLSVKNLSKIILLVIDGLGGLPKGNGVGTELEISRTPHLDQLAMMGNCGLTEPVGIGITPGSAPAHLALFGYDPRKYIIGRGVLEAIGINFELKGGDVAVRGNFCTVDDYGMITDRRAGRISTEKCVELCKKLQDVMIPGVEIFILPVKEHRFALVFRGLSLEADLSDTDPQREQLAPLPVTPLRKKAQTTADMVNEFINDARRALNGQTPANMILLRGFSKKPSLPSFEIVFKLKAAAIANYPMYKGLAKLVGMQVIPSGSTIEDEIATLEANYEEFTFFYMHIKGADSAGEDGDFARKVKIIEQVDNILPDVQRLSPDVLIVTGDHSTPAVMKSHSWHPVPFVLHSKLCRPDGVLKFSERDCLRGSLGTFPALGVMPLAMAHALKLSKYGA